MRRTREKRMSLFFLTRIAVYLSGGFRGRTAGRGLHVFFPVLPHFYTPLNGCSFALRREERGRMKEGLEGDHCYSYLSSRLPSLLVQPS